MIADVDIADEKGRIDPAYGDARATCFAGMVNSRTPSSTLYKTRIDHNRRRPNGWFAHWAIVLLVCGLAGFPSWSAAANRAGQIDFVEGDVHLIDESGVAATPKFGDSVREGQTLITGKDGEVHVLMDDDGYLALRPNTRIRVNSFLAEGGSKDNVLIYLVRGTFRAITGWIGHNSPHSYAVRTLNTTIGIRGTDHEPSYLEPSDALQLQAPGPGTYDKVNSGGTFLKGSTGTVVVAPGQSAHAPLDGQVRLLAKVPGFYRATKNEHRIEEKKVELERHLSEHRSLRRTEVEEKERSTAEHGHRPARRHPMHVPGR